MGEPTKRVFYTHLMKTGGTSLHRALAAHFGRERTYPRDVTMASKAFPHLLVGMNPEANAEYRYFCVHQPAWVAFEAAPDAYKMIVLRDPVERTISHLRQLARSPHPADDLTELYDDPTWRERLTNYQTQFLADTHERSTNPATTGEPDMSDPVVKHGFEQALIRFWGTSVKTPIAIDDAERAAALTTLERYDLVGTTDDLDRVRQQINTDLGLELPPVGRVNTTKDRIPVPDELRARIEADNEHDFALYRRARELAET